MTTPESAVQRCVKAYYHACDIEDPQNTGLDPDARYRVHLAYRHAMPYLLPDPDSIDAFLACVTHGLVIQVFEPAEASKLLYAAQVAIGSSRARHEAARQNSKSDSKPAPTPSPVEGGEGAVGRTAGAPLNQGDASEPQPSCAPPMATASSSPWVGDHEPQPTEPEAPTPTPLPPSQMVPKAQPATPQVPQLPRNQVEILLEQLYAGKLPAETPLTPCAAVLKAAPPTPSPLPQAPKAQPAAPQVPKGENTLLRVAS